ncbi:GAF and ANTAR domain-containing protein [Pseudoclavibacter sp. RFBA6]|uniref:GAF and ANTAR domain-containing protein n=1 Tax=Pseudoclavibacter sp. RFBA6 TaxID=2080573 RepID=UPI0015E1E38F|nr:GAF and ANTAR domain-containing protein [Pseudoclavibacter sp. RFBA6]
MRRQPFERAAETLSSPVRSVEGTAELFLQTFRVTGAAVSTIGDFLGNETVSASNDLAARIDELQFDLSEGPCWDALATRKPVLTPNMTALPADRWPAFVDAVSRERVGALFAFPMFVGHLPIGAVDMYASTPAGFSPRQVRQAAILADLLAKQVLRLSLDGVADAPMEDRRYSRRAIHQATGIVLAQLDISPDEAQLVIQGRAFATGRSMMEVAQDVIGGRIAFHMGPSGIEERR